MNILFLDIETTGLDPERDGILEIAAALYLDYTHNVPIATFHEVVNPYDMAFETSLAALAVNQRRLPLDKGYDGQSAHLTTFALRDFANWLLEIKKLYKEFVVCGQNVNFDISFIEAKLKKLGITELKALTGYRVLDLASVGAFFNLAGLTKFPKPSGDEMGKAFGLGESPHKAKADVDHTNDILSKLLEVVYTYATSSVAKMCGHGIPLDMCSQDHAATKHS